MEIPPLVMSPVKMSAKSHFGESNHLDEHVQSFRELLSDALKNTNDLQLASDKLNMALAAGRVEDISKKSVDLTTFF